MKDIRAGVPARRGRQPAATYRLLSMTVTAAGRRLLARVEDALDIERAAEFLARLRPHCKPRRCLIVDLQQVEFVDSDGVRALLELRRETDTAGGELRLVAPAGGRAHRTLTLLQLRDRLNVFETLAEAWSRSSAVTARRAAVPRETPAHVEELAGEDKIVDAVTGRSAA